MNESLAQSIAQATLWSRQNYLFIKGLYGDPPDWEKYKQDIADDIKDLDGFDVDEFISLMKRIYEYHSARINP